MTSTLQVFADCLKLCASPSILAYGIYEAILSWLYSRRWRNLLYLVPMTGIAIWLLANILFFHFYRRQQLPSEYWEVIQNSLSEFQRSNSSGPSSSASGQLINSQAPQKSNTFLRTEEIPPFAEALLRRMRQLERSNQRSTFLLGTVLERRGQIEQARSLMREIAPEGSRGYLGAHAWLAADRLQKLGVHNQNDLQILMHDLSLGIQWPGSQPQLRIIYADLLAREHKVPQAVDVLLSESAQDPELVIKAASLAKQHERLDLLKPIQDKMSVVRNDKIDKGVGTESDYVGVIALTLLTENPAEAARLAQAGLNSHPESLSLRRLLSDSYLAIYVQLRDATDTSQYEKLKWLDQALKSDPTNPLNQEHIAELVASGSLDNPAIVQRLREHLASGTATGVSHLLLAIGHLRVNELDQALVHLEVANGLTPNNPFIANNLALCIARLHPDQLPRARELIEVALNVSPADPEILDTYGEILALSQDFVGAIRAYDNALTVDPSRAGTRTKLALAYEKAGMTEMANSVRQFDQPIPNKP